MRKAFVLFLILSSGAVFAQSSEPTVETLEARASVRLNDLRCVIKIGVDLPVEQRTSLQLGSRDEKALPLFLFNPGVSLNHTFAMAPACNLQEADRLMKESWSAFGFLHDVPVKVTKETWQPIKNGNGACVQRVHEVVEMDLSPQLKLTSEKIVLNQVDGCIR